MWPIRREIDDVTLVDPKHRVNATHVEQRQMSEGAEATVGDQDISRLQGGMDVLDARHLMGAQGRGHDFEEQAGARVEQGQDPGDGEAASGGLDARLTEARLQFGGVGHRDDEPSIRNVRCQCQRPWNVSGRSALTSARRIAWKTARGSLARA